MNDIIETSPAGGQPVERKPWIRPTLQLLSANSAEADTGSAGDASPCVGADKTSKPKCS